MESGISDLSCLHTEAFFLVLSFLVLWLISLNRWAANLRFGSAQGDKTTWAMSQGMTVDNVPPRLFHPLGLSTVQQENI